MKTLKYKIILLLVLIALINSSILAFSSISSVCGTNPEKGCNAVQSSAYAKTFGISNAYYGVVIFSILSIIIMMYILRPSKRKKQIIEYSLTLGTIISLYFIYLQFIKIHAICKFCMVVDFSVIISLMVFLFWKEEDGKDTH